MMPHGRPYYDALLKGAGLEKAKDLLAYYIEGREVPERLERGGALVEKRNPNVTVRPFDKKRFASEVEKFRTVYNSAWERNWGFVPMTDHEIDHMAKQLKQVLDPGLIRIAEIDGQPVGFALALPDLNQALRHADGRLFPLGLPKILWYARKINRARVLVLGVVKEYRKLGIDVIMYRDLFRYGMEKGYYAGEFSWILEDNMAIRRPLEAFGAEVYKTYRVYQGSV
jgi:ribosomal protein S18 acetylase RimI-like enzyme